MEERKGTIVRDMVDDALWEDSNKNCQLMTLVTQGLVTDGR
jgi:hypothetical protein